MSVDRGTYCIGLLAPAGEQRVVAQSGLLKFDDILRIIFHLVGELSQHSVPDGDCGIGHSAA